MRKVCEELKIGHMKRVGLSRTQKKTLKEKMVVSARKGNLATAAMVMAGNEHIATGESWVVSQEDATAHAELMLIGRVCQNYGSNYTPGLTLVTVVEPCLMCLSAAAWAGYSQVAYIIPAARYQNKIPWMTDCKKLDKTVIARNLDRPVELLHLGMYEKEFAHVFELEMRQLLKE